MTMLSVGQFNPTHGDVADGRRVQMSDGSVACLAQVSGSWLVIHGANEYGPFSSDWQVLAELSRIDRQNRDRLIHPSHHDKEKARAA